MAACGSLQHLIFEPQNPPNSNLIHSLSSSSCLKPPSDHSFTEIFRELHFKEQNPNSSKPDPKPENNGRDDKWGPVSQNGYPGSSESLQLCTESLGFESLDNLEDLKIQSLDDNNINKNSKMREKMNVRSSEPKSNGKRFPPPISSINGRTGKPLIFFESYREDGRLLLKEVRIRTRDLLHACREHGRLRLCFVQPSDQDYDRDHVLDDDGDYGEEFEDSESNVKEEEREKGKEEQRLVNTLQE